MVRGHGSLHPHLSRNRGDGLIALKALTISTIDSVDCTPHYSWAGSHLEPPGPLLAVTTPSPHFLQACWPFCPPLDGGQGSHLSRCRASVPSHCKCSINPWLVERNWQKLLEWVETPRRKSGSCHLVIDEYSSEPL